MVYIVCDPYVCILFVACWTLSVKWLTVCNVVEIVCYTWDIVCDTWGIIYDVVNIVT